MLLARLAQAWGQGLRGQDLSLCEGHRRDHVQDPALAASPPLPQAPLGVDPGVHMLTEARQGLEGERGQAMP